MVAPTDSKSFIQDIPVNGRVKKRTTGIVGLNLLLDGGFPEGTLIMIYGTPLAGVDLAAVQFWKAEGGEEGTYFMNDGDVDVGMIDASEMHPEIYLTQLDGSPLKRLTELKGYVEAPAFSPDGKRVAFLYVEGATRPAGALAAMKPPAGVIGEEGLEIQRVAVAEVEEAEARDLWLHLRSATSGHDPKDAASRRQPRQRTPNPGKCSCLIRVECARPYLDRFVGPLLGYAERAVHEPPVGRKRAPEDRLVERHSDLAADRGVGFEERGNRIDDCSVQVP